VGLGGSPPKARILGEAGQALGGDALTPEAHGVPTRVHGCGIVLVVVALGGQQGNLGAERESRGRPPAARPLLQLLALGLSVTSREVAMRMVRSSPGGEYAGTKY